MAILDAIQNLFLGTNANDGTGDSARVAGGKLNQNFDTIKNSFNSIDSGKANKVANPTTNNIITTNATGQPQDSGKAFTQTIATNSTHDQVATAKAVEDRVKVIDGGTF